MTLTFYHLTIQWCLLFCANKSQCVGRALVSCKQFVSFETRTKVIISEPAGTGLQQCPCHPATPPPRSLLRTAPSRDFSTRLNIYCLMDVIVIKCIICLTSRIDIARPDVLTLAAGASVFVTSAICNLVPVV